MDWQHILKHGFCVISIDIGTMPSKLQFMIHSILRSLKIIQGLLYGQKKKSSIVTQLIIFYKSTQKLVFSALSAASGHRKPRFRMI